ncbi:MAG TPA: hypothetical protein VMU66_02620, partial [Gaiellales bacterium]|nr:hypothetical protein [Gaiellales bacterium]
AFAATALCVAAIGGRERRFLVGRSRPPRRRPGPLTAGELGALSAVAAVAVLQAAAPLAGIPPWWPICVVTAVASLASAVLGSGPAALRVPWRVGLEVLGLSAGAVVAVRLAGVQGLAGGVTGLPGLVAVALAAGLMAAVLNKLPASVVTAAVLAPWSRLA